MPVKRTLVRNLHLRRTLGHGRGRGRDRDPNLELVHDQNPRPAITVTIGIDPRLLTTAKMTGTGGESATDGRLVERRKKTGCPRETTTVRAPHPGMNLHDAPRTDETGTGTGIARVRIVRTAHAATAVVA